MPFAEKKRFIQSEARRIRNHAAKSRVKTVMKRVTSALESDDPGAVDTQLRDAMSALHKAGRKKILHPNTAARRIARLSKMVQR
ncbi:MAG: 30S ribosomal protein S20 [Desulfurellaceae bacterium]|nr:30S ribosomal protein S20 [Desulfurellaceae bacterium]